jgi:ribosome-binding protein aMBF1 (putative translation factor)
MRRPVATKAELTPEQRAAFRSIREQAEIDRPGPDELIERGDVEEFVSQGAFMELLGWVEAIRRERERKGLSLTDVAERSGLTRAMVSKLENGHNPNPTLDTLARYALAMDLELKLSADPIPAADAD